MGRVYTPDEIRILMQQQFAHFTEAELNELMSGEATLKVSYKADKVLDQHGTFMKKSMSREEAINNFVTFSTFNQLNNAVVVLKHLLMEAGLATEQSFQRVEHELIAKQMKNMCDTCSLVYPDCGSQPKFVKDRFDDVSEELGMKVVSCVTYKPTIQEGNC